MWRDVISGAQVLRLVLALAGWVAFSPFNVAVAGTVCGASITHSGVIDSDTVEDGYQDTHPVILSDGGSTWITMWEHWSNPSLYQTVLYSYVLARRSTNNGQTWSTTFWPSCKSASACFEFAGKPYIATNKSGAWIAAWTENHSDTNTTRGKDVIYSRSLDNGASWSDPAIINAAPVGPGLGFYVTDIAYGNNTWVITGTRFHAGRSQVFYFRSTNNGGTWSGPYYPDLSANLDATEPKIDTDNKGHWVIAWFSYDSGSAFSETGVRTVRSANNGVSWNSSVVPGFAQGALTYVDDIVYSKATNQWMIIWDSDVNLAGSTPAFSPADNLLYSISSNSGVSWSNAAWLYGNQNDSMGDGSARLHADNNGKVSVVWLRFPPSGTGPSDVYQKCQASSLASWSALKNINRNMLPGQVKIESPPDIATNNTGKLMAVWTAYRKPGGSSTSEGTVYLSSSTIPARDPVDVCVPCFMLLLED